MTEYESKKCNKYKSSYCNLEIDVTFHHTVDGIWVPTKVVLPDRQMLMDILQCDELELFVNTLYLAQGFRQDNQFQLDERSALNTSFFKENCFLRMLWEPSFQFIVSVLKNIDILRSVRRRVGIRSAPHPDNPGQTKQPTIKDDLFSLKYKQCDDGYEIIHITGIPEQLLPVRIWADLTSVCYTDFDGGADVIHVFSTTPSGIEHSRKYEVGGVIPKYLLNECLLTIIEVNEYIVTLENKIPGEATL